MEYTSITAPDAESLASALTEKSAEGWTLEGIAATGDSLSAILSKGAAAPSTASTAGASDASDASTSTAAAAAIGSATVEPATVEPATVEPAGWGTAASSSASSSYTPAATPSYTGASYTPAASAPSYAPAPAAVTPSVPAGWYADPAGRFELRYWDSTAWTEHVSRAGQQYTDPPVA